MRIALIIPTYNAGGFWRKVLAGIAGQGLQPERKLVIDSNSRDETAALAREAGFDVLGIDQRDFDQGGTRQLGAERCADCEVLIYMTQDVLLTQPEAFARLVAGLEDPQVAMAYGRQLPRAGASPIEAHARVYNYPPQDHIRTIADAERMGFKAAFSSDAFAAYRRSALMEAGGFPKRIIFGEDSFVTAAFLLRGWKVAYCAAASAAHSHAYTVPQEFRRYFDIGVFHQKEAWIQEKFGSPNGEGMRFVRSEIAYLLGVSPLLIPSAMVRTLSKWLGYQMGRRERVFPLPLKRLFSMHRGHWK
ncbi:MAG: hypothetical protein QOE70_1924 [Chthoniobacter sp.]|jgi:rhamnosyltransferase|nr:hypothetical protein [Chthoniobacter sp.]